MEGADRPEEQADRFLRGLQADGRAWWNSIQAGTYTALVGYVVTAWSLGIGNAKLREHLDRDLSNAGNIPAVWMHRLEHLIRDHEPTGPSGPTPEDIPVCMRCDARPGEPFHLRRRPSDPERPEHGDEMCPWCNPRHPEFDLEALFEMLTAPASA